MRKTNLEIIDPHVIEGILKTSSICRLAMTDGNVPYLVPFNYGYENHSIYIHSAPEGKKISLLKKNARVCFEIENIAEIVRDEKACNWSTYYRSVIGHGNVEIITDTEEKIEGLRIIMKHNGATGPFMFEENNVKRMVILKVVIEDITGKQSSNRDRIANLQKYTIPTERLVLKEITPADMDQIYHLRTFPEVDRYNTLGIPKDLQETVNVYKPFIEDKKNLNRNKFAWCIFLKDGEQFIGEAGMILSADRFRLGEIYYNLMPEYWGRGYGTETAKALIRFGFDEMKLHKVEAGAATENTRSIKVLEKSGMVREGLRRKILPIRGEWKDNYHYAIVESDLR